MYIIDNHPREEGNIYRCVRENNVARMEYDGWSVVNSNGKPVVDGDLTLMSKPEDSDERDI